MPRRAKIWKNEASGDPDGPPGRKMGCRGVPTSKKLEKQRFGMPRRAARKKNWLSGCPETPKNGKMKRRGGPTSKKSEK